MTELDKLEAYLKENSITYERRDEPESIYRLGMHIICVPEFDPDNRQYDAICQYGSYGYEEGLLEIMGDIVDVKAVGDTVEGWLTAKEVIERIEKVHPAK